MVKYYNSHSRQNEVISNFIKIAAEKEIIDKNLYDVDTGEDKTGKELIERAHPETAHILDSYRTDADIVENEVEQQEEDILAAERMPNGTVHRKTTEAENLINELVIIADEMDARGEEEVAKFADFLLVNLHKEAVIPLAVPIIGGLAAAAVGGWWLSSYSNKSDPKNTGIDANIAGLQESVSNYINELTSEQTGEESSQIISVLNDVQSNLENVQRSREAYMNVFAQLANKLRNLTKIDPTTKIDPEQIKKLSESKEAQYVIERMKIRNNEYKKFINEFLTTLQSNYNYIKKYFELTKNIRGVNVSTFDKIMQSLGLQKELASEGNKIIESLGSLIVALKSDIQLRELETNESLRHITQKVQTDVGKFFEEEPADKSKLPPGAIEA